MTHLHFGPFVLDTLNQCLWRDTEAVVLTPKMFAILHYLVTHPGQLVTKDELLSAVWAGTYVSDAALKVCIRRTRDVLQDDPKAPRFIETVQRRGYRFIGEVTPRSQVEVSGQKERGASGIQSTYASQSLTPTLVGRETELAQLQRWWDRALTGTRQIVFLTGEEGIGKTALAEAFLQQVRQRHTLSPRGSGCQLVWGQCVEHYGAGEAYLPVLEALAQLCRPPHGTPFCSLLSRYAPTWLAQLPWLVPDTEQNTLHQRVAGATKERMLREIAEFLEAATVETPLLLVLEDLQWSDYSTLDCLAYLARRREPARLLLLATYRPTEANERRHPLETVKHELQVHGHCHELPLQYLSEAAVAAYVQQQLQRLSSCSGTHTPAVTTPPMLVQFLHQRTEGNPLFLIHMLDHLITQQAITQTNGHWSVQCDMRSTASAMPDSLRQMIRRHVERLPVEEQQLLAVASVVGAEFTAAAVAAGLAQDPIHIEEQCEDLAQHACFVQPHGAVEWPDGTVTARYRFIHSLYRDALYESIPAGKRATLHRRVGIRLAQGYGSQAHDIAAELAVHFERGRDYDKAVQYLRQAAKNAIRRCGYREAIEHLQKGLGLLRTVADTPQHRRQEIVLRLSLGLSLVATKGYADTEVGRVYSQALALCEQEETPQRYWALWGVQIFSLMRAELQRARVLGEQLFQLAERLHDPELLGVAHYVLATTLTSLGELLPARAHLEQAIALCAAQQHDRLRTACLSFLPRVLWGLGYPTQAEETVRQALVLSQAVAHPFTAVMTSCLAALLYLMRREWRVTQYHAETALRLADEYGFTDWWSQALIFQGYAMVHQGSGQEGILRMQQGIAAYDETGAVLGRPLFRGLLADAYGRVARPEEGLGVLADALATTQQQGLRLQEAWLHWRKGELVLQVAETQHAPWSPLTAQHTAEACFHHALALTRQYHAKSLELRVATSLCRLWHRQGRNDDARRLLAQIYGWFTEGFDTADLQEAKMLLDELGPS